jgi:hypothetical protein
VAIRNPARVRCPVGRTGAGRALAEYARRRDGGCAFGRAA